MNTMTQDLERLIGFRSAIIAALPQVSIFEGELGIPDMIDIMTLLKDVNAVLDKFQAPVTISTGSNVPLYDPNEVKFDDDNSASSPTPVAQKFSKLDLLGKHTNDLWDDVPPQPVSRADLMQSFPAAPQVSSYGNDLKNDTAKVNIQVYPAEVAPWNELPTEQSSNTQQIMQLQQIIANAAMHGNLEIVMRDLGMIP